MPFPSLRRRTVDATPGVSDGAKPVSPISRSRSATLPALSPRKSLSSIIDSALRGRTASPSRSKLHPGARETDLDPEYDASSPEVDLERPSRTPSPSKAERLRRAPSPHPLKGFIASSSPKTNGTRLGRRRSESSMKSESPPKTFLETLANAIRAPASLFYKENKQDRKEGDTDDLIRKTTSSSSASTPSTAKPAPGGGASPKKSVRFRPGKAGTEPEARSSPIDIPKNIPAMPQYQLPTEQLLQCSKQVETPIPTGRPPPTHIMRSSKDFQRALAETKPSDILDNLGDGTMTGTSLSILPTPLPGTNAPMEGPSDDAAEETDPDASRGMLKEYDERIQSGKSQKSLSSTDAIIDREFPSNDETVQETGFSSFPELVEQKEEHVEDRPPEYQEYSASRTALTESHDLTISEHGPETGETRLANSSPESSRAVSTSRTGDTEASTSPSMTPYEQLLERRLSLIAGDCRFLDPASGSETTSEDMEGCSSASLCPTETVKSLGPDDNKIGEGTIFASHTSRVCVPDSDSDDDGDLEPVATDEGPKDGKPNPSMASENLAPLDGVLPSQKAKRSFPIGKTSASDVSFYRFTLEQAGLSALQPLALPTPPTIRSLSRPYSDQYGWIPFDEYQFVYAARVALDIWEDDFRAILATEGGFRRFWDSCDLPRWSAPSKDTKALSLWEIDDLLNSINEYPLLPEPVPSLMYGDFKSRITRSSVERAQGQRVLPQYRPDEVTEESVCTEAESSLLSTSEFRDDPEHDADDSSGSSSLLSVDAPSVPAITTEERMANVAKVLHNFRPREVKRLETDETDIIERGLETMSMYSKSAEPAFEVGGPTEEVFLKAAKGESEPAQNGLAIGSDPACCSCSICARTIEELQSSKLTRHEKRDERDSTESELSRCCGDSSEDSNGDEKHCQGIV